MPPIRLAAAGLGKAKGGIQAVQLSVINQLVGEGLVDLVAVSDLSFEKPSEETAAFAAALLAKGQEVIINKDTKQEETLEHLTRASVSSYDNFVRMVDGTEADAVYIATPHQFHLPMAQYALCKGLHVLTEKPPAVTPETSQTFLDIEAASNRVVGVNYMNIAAQSALGLKTILDSGKLGAIKNISGFGKWKRRKKYYTESTWRGQKLDKHGAALLDGCMLNQFPHQLNQMLYFIAGDGVPILETVNAELYRCHDPSYMQMEDTVSIYARANGVDINFYGTVCNKVEIPELTMTIECENGTATWTQRGYRVEYNDTDTPDDVFNLPEEVDHWRDANLNNMRNFIDAIDGKPLYWNLAQALKTTQLADLAYVCGPIHQVGKQYVKTEPVEVTGTDTSGRVAEGKDIDVELLGASDIIDECLKDKELYSKITGWGRPSRDVTPANIGEFNIHRI